MSKPLRYAMNVLSVRDHSEVEIRRKLAAYLHKVVAERAEADEMSADVALAEIESAIAYCIEHDWLNDARFARRYISSRSRKGYGVQRIRSELSQKGIDKTTIAAALNECDIDWCELAKSVAERKFGHPLPVEWKEKAKLQRYLLYRGFFHEEIQSIYTNFSD
ncbi:MULTISPECIES: recombination regulator RecX [unclassified Brenneria]|uniref:recombination regulator RecX n=1 Tax=unclassified Brenneria TaxID=2634434 RepID=UPI001553BA2E|nr:MULTISPECIES: recombination regulator RecX [unclassified Brenneria]MBJ7224027.1 recombination regulator RecX [Brenneria sp. L3-3C-1]MEE3645272.1 recombination regulator RecX [Brenneria sp. L3_3C_1]MEE3653050.1 recombination regulator RecX [Brenneria sp. HEZEL_4_2_4]NPD03003.1 recombination regulator RecX [Brenneria sp. hezel4-2-4]